MGMVMRENGLRRGVELSGLVIGRGSEGWRVTDGVAHERTAQPRVHCFRLRWQSYVPRASDIFQL
jgi:hypothetical protein